MSWKQRAKRTMRQLHRRQYQVLRTQQKQQREGHRKGAESILGEVHDEDRGQIAKTTCVTSEVHPVE